MGTVGGASTREFWLLWRIRNEASHGWVYPARVGWLDVGRGRYPTSISSRGVQRTPGQISGSLSRFISCLPISRRQDPRYRRIYLLPTLRLSHLKATPICETGIRQRFGRCVLTWSCFCTSSVDIKDSITEPQPEFRVSVRYRAGTAIVTWRSWHTRVRRLWIVLGTVVKWRMLFEITCLLNHWPEGTLRPCTLRSKCRSTRRQPAPGSLQAAS